LARDIQHDAGHLATVRNAGVLNRNRVTHTLTGQARKELSSCRFASERQTNAANGRWKNNMSVQLPISTAGAQIPQMSEKRQRSAFELDQLLRFRSLWFADGRFRDALIEDAEGAVAARGLLLNPYEFRICWDRNYRVEVDQLPREKALRHFTPLSLAWLGWERRDIDYRKRVRAECEPINSRLAAWREKQIERCASTFRNGFASTICHYPFAIEISKGCSVGCWFCGVSAPKLHAHFRYTDKNAEAFGKVLKALSAVAGPTAAKWGFLYWASDPLDNPDYEFFGADFARVFGQFPATTTARGWREMDRTKQLIQRTAAESDALFRLSILNLKVLDRYLAELSPAELARIRFVPMNKESYIQPAQSGRGRDKAPGVWGSLDAHNAGDTSIACVTGFLLNLVERNVKLVSACESSHEWPLGYYVFEENTFEHAEDLASLLDGMIERQWHHTVPSA
jgi:radical SAM family RiPP maturation amino acid epimerase